MRWILCWYALQIAARELSRCERWPRETRRMAWAVAGGVLAFPVLLIGLPSYVWWFLTGRGPVRWLGLMRYPKVNPFGKPDLATFFGPTPAPAATGSSESCD